jgi:hypothetical protein
MGVFSAIVLAALVTAAVRQPMAVPAPRATLAALLLQHGSPAFTAQSFRVENKRLVAPGLELLDPATVTLRRLKGRSLIFSDGRATLLLGAANAAERMQAATPLLGDGRGRTQGMLLRAPIRVLLVATDANGRVVRAQAATVTELVHTPAIHADPPR